MAAHVAAANLQGRPYAVISLAVGATDAKANLEGLLLHWACVAGQGQEWQQPPAGWHTDPDYSQGAGTCPHHCCGKCVLAQAFTVSAIEMHIDQTAKCRKTY